MNGQLGLFEQEEGKSKIKVPRKKIIAPKNWGVSAKTLNGLRFSQLETLFYGIHNLTVPRDMLNLMTGIEVVSKFYSAGSLKRYNSHLVEKSDLPRDFLGLVKKMDIESNYRLRGLPIRFWKGFPESYSDLSEKFSDLSEDNRQAFVDSFFSEYVPSLREAPLQPNAFYDPNCDGHNKMIYARAVNNFLNKRWEESR